jgi:Ca-activated chloride channel homolog
MISYGRYFVSHLCGNSAGCDLDRDMSFIWPAMLLAVLTIPVFALVYFRFQRIRRQKAASFGALGFGGQDSTEGGNRRRYLPSALFFSGLTILVFALARPQTTVSLPRLEGTVVLAFDVSGSMAADDLEPTRMEAAKAAAIAFVQQQPASILIGVVSFSDSGFTILPPTSDQEAIFAAINRLVPQRGTSLGNGTLTALGALEPEGESSPLLYSDLTPQPTPTPTPVPRGQHLPAVIVLLTDGENNEFPDPIEVAQEAANRGVRIYTVGIGSPLGANLEIEGFSIHTQLDENLLRQISEITGGQYFNAETEEELQDVYKNLNPQLVTKPEKMEITSLIAGAGMFILLLGGGLSLLWFSHLP